MEEENWKEVKKVRTQLKKYEVSLQKSEDMRRQEQEKADCTTERLWIVEQEQQQNVKKLEDMEGFMKELINKQRTLAELPDSISNTINNQFIWMTNQLNQILKGRYTQHEEELRNQAAQYQEITKKQEEEIRRNNEVMRVNEENRKKKTDEEVKRAEMEKLEEENRKVEEENRKQLERLRLEEERKNVEVMEEENRKQLRLEEERKNVEATEMEKQKVIEENRKFERLRLEEERNNAEETRRNVPQSMRNQLVEEQNRTQWIEKLEENMASLNLPEKDFNIDDFIDQKKIILHLARTWLGINKFQLTQTMGPKTWNWKL
jgi:hypothetical protein